MVHSQVGQLMAQRVVLDGQASDTVPVLSDVSQGLVLGPILFLIFINDLPVNIRSSVCLLADDVCLCPVSRCLAISDSICADRTLSVFSGLYLC